MTAATHHSIRAAGGGDAMIAAPATSRNPALPHPIITGTGTPHYNRHRTPPQ